MGESLATKQLNQMAFEKQFRPKKRNNTKNLQNSKSTKIEKKNQLREAAIAKHIVQYFAHITKIARLGFEYLFYFIVISVERGSILTKFRI